VRERGGNKVRNGTKEGESRSREKGREIIGLGIEERKRKGERERAKIKDCG
jgi:hypothetical protein